MKTGRIEHRWRLAVLLIALVMPLEATGAQRKASPKAEVVQPKAGQSLRGIVDVQLKLPAGLSGPAYAGLGGPPWVKLEQVDDSNEWAGRINSRMVPNGDQKLTVKTTNKRSDVAVGVTVENPLQDRTRS